MLSVDALLLFQRSDVAQVLAQRERFAGLKLLAFDHGLLDEAMAGGLPNVEFRRLDIDPDLQARATAEALTRATLVDLRLGALRRQLFGDAMFDGWDVGLFHNGLLRLLVARAVGEAVERGNPGARIGLLRPAVPQQFYFESATGIDLVARDPARWCVVGGYETGRLYNPKLYEFAFDAPNIASLMAQERPTAITHVPSCFYDRARIEEEVARRHPVSLDLPSLLWDVPVRRRQTLLRPLATLPAADPRCSIYAERARPLLQLLLGDLLPQPASREAQLDSWTQRCRLQAINFFGLRSALHGHTPEFVLTDHDAGNNGVLFSVADALGSSISVLPHSSHPAMLLPHGRRVTAIERAGFGTRARTVLGQPVAVRPVRWRAPAAAPTATRIRTLCLLLNAAHTEGLSYNDLLPLVAFHKPLAALCERADVELVVRPKPGSPAIRVISGALGIDALKLQAQLTAPLDDLAARTQLCIAFDEPSTGMLAFLEAGACVVNACAAPWTIDLVACPPLVADGVVPSLRLNDALQAVQALLIDAEHFRRTRDAQADAFARRTAGAHDTLFTHPTPSGA